MSPNARILSFAFAASLVGSSACLEQKFGAGLGRNEDCELGSEGCFCLRAKGCEAGLICVDDRCHPLPQAQVPSADKDSSSPDPEEAQSESTQSDQESPTPEPDPDPSQSSPTDAQDSSSEEEPPPSCTDTLLNGSESDIDCGGDCPGCEAGQICHVDEDCQSSRCESGICQPPPKKACTTDRDCDDNNVCTRESCVNLFCERSKVAEGTKCNDGDLCTAKDACRSGECRGKSTLLIDDDFSSAAKSSFRPQFQPPNQLWQIGPAKKSNCSPRGRPEDPGTDHSPDDSNGVLGVSIGGCNEQRNSSPLDCVWSEYIDPSFFDEDLHLSFWRHLGTPGAREKAGQTRVLNFQYYRYKSDPDNIREIKHGFPTGGMWDQKWEYDDSPINKRFLKGPLAIGVCYRRAEGTTPFPSWTIDDFKVRQKGCLPKG